VQDKRCYDDILEVIGNTPMVRLNRITAGLACQVYAKLEFLNPMGSSKDRIARHSIEAERDGRLQPGDLIENSLGNTAMGMAMVAIQKGYRMKGGGARPHQQGETGPVAGPRGGRAESRHQPPPGAP
jgi:cystathionine beta-synthase